MYERRVLATGALCLAALVLPTAAVAQEYTGDYVDYVGRPSPDLKARDVAPDVAVLGTTTTRDAMPVTGGDLVGLAVLGLGTVAIGRALVRASGTRSNTA